MRLVGSLLVSLCVPLTLVSGACSHAGTTWTCASVADWVTILKAGTSAGDTVILNNGVYSDTAKFTIAGTNLNIQAQSNGGVTFTGDIAITNTASGSTFTGFQFNSPGQSVAGSGTAIKSKCNDCKYTQLNFNGWYSQHYIVIDTTTYRNEISYCTFSRKPDSGGTNQGSYLQINANTASPLYTWIHHNLFIDSFGPSGDGGNEPIRLGEGAYSTMNQGSLVEHNVFNNTGGGDSEAISVKSTNNIIRYNTFTNQHNSQLTFRNGYYNEAYGNFFINAGGLRFKAASHIYAWNNYFENCYNNLTTQSVGNCVFYDDTTTSTDLQDINVLFNTFYNSGWVDFGLGTSTIATTLANNVFQTNSQASWLYGAYSSSQVTFHNNIYQGTVGITPTPSGLTSSDAKLSFNSDGYYSPQDVTSGVKVAPWTGWSIPSYGVPTGALTDDYPVNFDIGYQSRTSNKDLGCSEAVGAGAYVPSTVNRPYTWADITGNVVGNNYAY